MSKQTEKHQIKLNEEINFSTWYIKNTQPTEHTPSSPGSQLLGFGTPISLLMPDYPPREVTYPIPRHFLKMLFLFHPLPNMGYVRSLEGNHLSNQKNAGWAPKLVKLDHKSTEDRPQGNAEVSSDVTNQVITKKNRGVRGWWFQPIGKTAIKMRILPK